MNTATVSNPTRENSTRALVVEDNVNIRELVTAHLKDASIDVSEAARLHDALALVKQRRYDIAILDISLPDGSGYDICRELRAQLGYTPVIMLTARDADADRVLGLELGADDYVTKPFSVSELVARVRAQVRRSAAEHSASRGDAQTGALEFKNILIDVAKRQVHCHGQNIALTAREFDLLCFLAQQPGRVFSRAQLLDGVWGHGYDGYEHTVNSHINRLRAKIEQDVAKPEFVKTIWGVGYSFQSV